MDEQVLKYWVAFNRIPKIGRARFALLEHHFGSLERAWGATPSDLEAAGLDSRIAQLIDSRRPAIDPEAESRRLESLDVRAITWHDAEYPSRLKEIYDLPPILYIRGALLPEDERSVSLVGTRKPTAYGREVA